jgi:hypothetical protein
MIKLKVIATYVARNFPSRIMAPLRVEPHGRWTIVIPLQEAEQTILEILIQSAPAATVAKEEHTKRHFIERAGWSNFLACRKGKRAKETQTHSSPSFLICGLALPIKMEKM